MLSYRELRDQAKILARRLLGLGLERGARVGIIAETDPMFHRFFFACQYAGASSDEVLQVGVHTDPPLGTSGRTRSRHSGGANPKACTHVPATRTPEMCDQRKRLGPKALHRKANVRM